MMETLENLTVVKAFEDRKLGGHCSMTVIVRQPTCVGALIHRDVVSYGTRKIFPV
jgi:hypothetical protein